MRAPRRRTFCRVTHGMVLRDGRRRRCSSSVPVERVQAVVIGAGVIGLATARALAQTGYDVLILEREATFGMATSSRNSEVIHAGVYYPPSSWKAKLCVKGRDLLYGYCQERAIPHHAIGKLIVATQESQLATLQQLQVVASSSLAPLHWKTAEDVAVMEPQVSCRAALFSPRTGIVDSHALLVSLLAEAQEKGATLVPHTTVFGASVVPREQHHHHGGLILHTGSTRHPKENHRLDLQCHVVVNCAGLQAHLVAQSLATSDSKLKTEQHFAKGNYFRLQGVPCPFSHLIYPVPQPGGLGIHATMDVSRQSTKFGPDVEWIDRLEDDASMYQVSPERTAVFEQAIRQYWPALPDDCLVPDYAGIRPKVKSQDFVLQGPQESKIPGFVNLLGIESPGLTSSLAIAQHIVDNLLGEAK